MDRVILVGVYRLLCVALGPAFHSPAFHPHPDILAL